MKVTDRVNYIRIFRCTCCGWVGTDREFTSEDEQGNDCCPACGETDFEKVDAGHPTYKNIMWSALFSYLKRKNK